MLSEDLSEASPHGMIWDAFVPNEIASKALTDAQINLSKQKHRARSVCKMIAHTDREKRSQPSYHRDLAIFLLLR